MGFTEEGHSPATCPVPIAFEKGIRRGRVFAECRMRKRDLYRAHRGKRASYSCGIDPASRFTGCAAAGKSWIRLYGNGGVVAHTGRRVHAAGVRRRIHWRNQRIRRRRETVRHADRHRHRRDNRGGHRQFRPVGGIDSRRAWHGHCCRGIESRDPLGRVVD